MIGRIVEISDDARHLSQQRGFMVVVATGEDRGELGRIPLDDIAAVIANAHGLSYTNNLLVALAERNTPFVLCGKNHNAVGMLLPIDGNYQQSKRFDAQIRATKPTQKRVWAALVKAKIEQQASVLEAIGKNPIPIRSLIEKIRSGDPNNIEAQAARRYWTILFGEDFRREQSAEGINSFLNYGYTIVRACTARAVVSAGLHPSLGVHHSNEGNPMRLVDDLMEPFRPLIDFYVWKTAHIAVPFLSPEIKRELVMLLFSDMHTSLGMTPVTVCIQRLAVSLVQIYLGEKTALDLPLSGDSLSLLA